MTRDTNPAEDSHRPPGAASRAMAVASGVAIAFFAIAGLTEAGLVRVLQPTASELDWVSDAILSCALGVAMYLWLYLRATRQALTARERDQLVIQTQLSLAEAMQRRLLPSVPPPSDGFSWSAMLTPAGRIGGDFFDFVEPVAGVRLLLIADVSGKGIAAAMALTLLRSVFRHVARETTSPAELAVQMSAAFYDEWQGSPYVTAMVVRVDAGSRSLTYTNAGHPAGAIIYGEDIRSLAAGGPPLGLLRGAEYVEDSQVLTPGGVCVFVTDGITEAVEANTQSWRSLAVSAARRSSHSADAVCEAIMTVAQRSHGPQGVEGWTDDRTVIVLTVGEAGRGA